MFAHRNRGSCPADFCGRAIWFVIIDRSRNAAGTLQLCADHENGIKAAIHAMGSVYNNPGWEGILLADPTDTAFNVLNRQECIRNIQRLCPAKAPLVVNTYCHPACPFVGGEAILSREGTDQGNPIAVLMYALGILLLIKHITTKNTVQAWFADDAGAGAKLVEL